MNNLQQQFGDQQFANEYQLVNGVANPENQLPIRTKATTGVTASTGETETTGTKR